MERFQSDSAVKDLENVLIHGGELAKQLQLHLNTQSSSRETLLYLMNEILNTYDLALSVLDYGGTGGGAGGGSPQGKSGAMVATMPDSPRSPLTGRPHSNHSDQEDEARRIRCKHEKGCLARKQVERLDEDPTGYEVTYKGLHNNPPVPIIHPQNELKTPLSHDNQIDQSQEEPFLNIQTSLKIIDNSNDKQYYIPSSSKLNPENISIFSEHHLLWEDNLLDFIYPMAPELNFFNDYEKLISDSEVIESAAKPPSQDADFSFDSSSGQLWSSFDLEIKSHFP